MPRGKSDKYSIHLSEADLDELDKLAQATKDQNSEVKKAGYTAMLNDVLQRSDTAIVMQEQSQAYMQRTAKWLFVIIVAMSILLLANFALTFSAIELSKESHVKLGTLTDTAGKVVQVASSDFHLGPGGKMVQRTSGRRLAEGDQPGGAIGTAPVLSKYKLSSRIPNKYLEELESITMARPCAKDATVAECDSKPTAKAIVKSFKRKPREGSHCGSVVVFQTDMGELTLDDETLYHDGAEMAADGVFSLADSRLTNVNISSEGRRLMEAGSAPAADANLHGAFKFLGDVNGDEFTCEMGGVIGETITITPPEAPAIPYTYLVRKESTCMFGEGDNACESEVTAGWRPGMAQHSNFTTMRSYEQVLLTHAHRVVVSYFASQPLSRLIQITHFASMVSTQYISFRRGRAKINCLVKPVEGARRTTPGSENREVHLAYLSTADDDGRESMRWALSPYDEQGNIAEYMRTEYWERVGTRKPRRIFLQGESVIAPGVSVSLMATPQEFVDFNEGLAEEEVAHWIKTTLGLPDMDDAVECPADGLARGSMPPYLGPFGEAGAQWIASQLQEDDLEGYDHGIVWSSSYYKYWNAVVASLGSPPLQAASGGRRLGRGRRLSAALIGPETRPVGYEPEEDEDYKGEIEKDPSYPKAAADMEEFMGCIKEAKDCLTGGRRLRRLSDSSQKLEWQNEDIARMDALKASWNEKLKEEIPGAHEGTQKGQGCIRAALQAMTELGVDAANTGLQEARCAGDMGSDDCAGYEPKIEISCGPCTIKIKLLQLDWPDFECIFEGGSGCYWKTDGKGVKLSIVGGDWEKWKVKIPKASDSEVAWTCGLEVGPSISFTTTTEKESFCGKPGGSQVEYVGMKCGLNKIQWNSVRTLDPAPGKTADECQWSRVPGCVGPACFATELVAVDHAEQAWNGQEIDPDSGLQLKSVVKHDGMYVWDLDKSWLIRSGTTGWTSKPIAQEYTQCYAIEWRDEDGIRSLAHGDEGEAIHVNKNGKLGMWSSDPKWSDGSFRSDPKWSDRYTISTNEWNMVCIVGRGDTPTSFTGTTDFYVATDSNQEMQQKVGTADRVVSGMTIQGIGSKDKCPGKLAWFKHWNFARDLAELQALAAATLEQTARSARLPVMELRAADQQGEDVVDPRSGMTFGKMPVTTYDGRAVWDLDNDYMKRVTGPLWVVKQDYTQCVHIDFRRSGRRTHVYRTLFKSGWDRAISIKTDAKHRSGRLGMKSRWWNRRRGNEWREMRDPNAKKSGQVMAKSGFRKKTWFSQKASRFRLDMRTRWNVLCVVGRKCRTCTHPIGTSDFYIATPEYQGSQLRHVGTSDRVVTGSTIEYIGYEYEYPGKLASFVHWNYALDLKEMNGFSVTALRGTPHVPTVELVAARQYYDEVVCPRTGTYFGTHSVTLHDGETVWNLDNDFLEWCGSGDHEEDSSTPEDWCTPADARWTLDWTGPGITKSRFTVERDYTQCYHLKWKEGSSVERTLFVGKNGNSENHVAFVPKGGDSLGMQSGGFHDSGYDINVAEWNVLCIRGRGSRGKRWQDFWVATKSDRTMKRVGSVNHVVSGSEVYRIGGAGPGELAGPGKLAMFKHWDYAMPKVHMQVVADGVFNRANSKETAAGAGGSLEWKKEWLGTCGVAPTNMLAVPADCYSCPTVIKIVMNTEEAPFCAKSGGTKLEYTGTSCGMSKIIWNSVRALDPADGKTPEECTRTRGEERAPDINPARATVDEAKSKHMCELRALERGCRLYGSRLIWTNPGEVGECGPMSFIDPMSGTAFKKQVVTRGGQDFQYKAFWNLDEDSLKLGQHQGLNMYGGGVNARWSAAQQYTQCYHLLWRQNDRQYGSRRDRTLFQGFTGDIAVMVNKQRWLGVWSPSAGFRSSGYSMTNADIAEWNVVCAVGRGRTDTMEYPASTLGTTYFYLATESAPTLRLVGTSDRVVSGVQLHRIGADGSRGPGKLVEFNHWNYELNLEEMQNLATRAIEPEKLPAAEALKEAERIRKADLFGSCGVAPASMGELPTSCSDLPETSDGMKVEWEGPVPSDGMKVAIQSADNDKFFIDDGGMVGVAEKAGPSAKWTLEDAGDGKIFIISHEGRHLRDQVGLLQLTDPTAGRAQYEKWVQQDAPGAGYYLWSHFHKYLSSPAGSFGCTLCVDLINRKLGEKAGLAVTTCVGFGDGCWFYIEIIGERVPKPTWAASTGIMLTVTGYIKICVMPLSIYGWVMLKLERGFCRSFAFPAFTITFSIYGGLKFELLWEMNNSNGGTMTFIGSAFVGVSGGVYLAGGLLGAIFDEISSWGGRRRRRRRRRRHKCRCGRVDAKGAIKSCPRKASAYGQITFTVKVWPCAEGKDAAITGTIGFEMGLELFGITIPLPKIPDITLFRTNLRKPFGPY